jgi:adenine-specific DNA-methyltransferase
MVYAKDVNNYEMRGFPLGEEQVKEYDKEDELGKYKEVGFRKTGKGWRRKDRPLMFYPIYFNESTGEISLDRKSENDIEILPLRNDSREGRWRWEKKTFLERKDKDIAIRKVRTGRWSIFTKMRLNANGKERTLLPKSVWIDPEYDTAKGAAVLTEIFGKDVFDNPKPLDFIIDILRVSTETDSLILDSFAGSGTTAHAVLGLNKEDGGNRKFILVECEDYADKITAERVRRVIKGVKNAKDEKLKNGLGGTFSYFELGDPIEMESILEGDKLPSFLELARYVFYTATGEEFDPAKVDEKRNFIGESREYEVYLFYKPDIEYLKSTALTLERAKSLSLPPSRDLGRYNNKRRLVFAPSKYLDTDYLLEYRIDYCQLPFEIYKLKE